jgi:hypothetical protein
MPFGTRSLPFNNSQKKPFNKTEAWERLQDYISACPHHGMEDWFIIQSFYHGLIRTVREHIDAAAGGHSLLSVLRKLAN